ncbi:MULTISPECIES: histidine-type phosphatase [Pseudomonas]|uniref:histidine-type phosphatase n=1 Tax=Pseudomonas TaxID=286 RepID=UPI000D3F7E26|nr:MULTISPECIES: histidine-type phosphatase [Pseudomonas]POR71287.1 4-phytase [Pseudomonas syringae pv. syringae]POR80559.1 4-phytase [Pseudomonas syringae pv. syringae]
MMKSTLLKYAGLALGVCLALPSVAAPLDTTGLRLDKVVLVMRHGIRPATDTAELQRWSARTWPAFGARDGQLTEHGRAATVLLGQWQRHTLDSLGLFKAGQCPQAGDAYVWSSPVARTQATSAALVKGMFPGCNVAIHHVRESEDRLFHGGKNGLAPLDPARTQAAMLAAMGGSVDAARERFAAPLLAMQQLAGVPTNCGKKTCALSKQPWALKEKAGVTKLSGPLSVGAAMSETFRMQYAEGLPLDQVAFGEGRTAADVSRLMALRSGKYALSNHVPYIAQRGASQLLGQILLALQPTSVGSPPGSKWLAYVGHDSNIAQLRTLLGFDWKIAEYPENDAAPGGTIVFERWANDRTGAQFVSVAYVAQSLDQLRNLSGEPPYQVQYPGYAGEQLMPMNGFVADMEKRIDRSATEVQHYDNP